ncbi:MAG: phosphoribosyl-AMP cyclohydrolase [Promethearchaeota archaeon]
MSKQIEETTKLSIDFKKIIKIQGKINKTKVIPVAVQDADTKDLLIIAYINKKALDYTIENKIASFWSTSRNELWIKGKKSGDILELVEIRINCEQNSLLFLVRPKMGGVCHTKDKSGNTRKTCYYRKINLKTKLLEFLKGMK